MWERWKARLDAPPDCHSCSIGAIRRSTGSCRETGGIRPPQRCRSRVALTLGRARGDLPRGGGRPLDSLDRCAARASAIDRQPRDQTQRRSGRLPGQPGRPGCLGSRASPQALQAGREPSLGAHRGRQAAAAVVARADRRLAQAYLSGRREPPRVTRDHLPQPVHSSAWRLEEGAAAALEAHARHAPLSPLHAEDRRSTARSSTPCRSASGLRRSKIGRCLATGKATCCSAARNSQIATLVERQTRYVMLVKLDGKDTQTVVNALIKNARKLPQELYKSLTWDRGKEMAWPQALHAGHRHPGLLLRSAEPLAARQQREHERAAQAVPAQGHRHLELLTGQAQRDRETIEREAEEDARLPNAG